MTTCSLVDVPVRKSLTFSPFFSSFLQVFRETGGTSVPVSPDFLGTPPQGSSFTMIACQGSVFEIVHSQTGKEASLNQVKPQSGCCSIC